MGTNWWSHDVLWNFPVLGNNMQITMANRMQFFLVFKTSTMWLLEVSQWPRWYFPAKKSIVPHDMAKESYPIDVFLSFPRFNIIFAGEIMVSYPMTKRWLGTSLRENFVRHLGPMTSQMLWVLWVWVPIWRRSTWWQMYAYSDAYNL